MTERVEILTGDCREILPTLPEKSVHCCVTSPPYFGLRDYGCDGQIGLEPTPDEYVSALVGVFREVHRVLRDDGTLWLNLGITYAGSTMTGGNKGINASGGKDGFKQKRQFRRASCDKFASQSPLLQRVPACDNDGKGFQDYQISDLSCPCSCDEHQVETQNHHVRNAHNGQCVSQDEQPTCMIGRDTEHLDCGQEPLDALLPASRVSMPLSFSGGSFLNGSNHSPSGGHRTLKNSSFGGVHPSGDKSACTCGTSQMLPPLAVRTVGKESFFSACGSPDCKGIGCCGLCWVNLTISSLKIKPKDEINIPHLVAMALQADGWFLRSTIIWSKPNPMPESVTDRPTKAHEYLFLLVKSQRYYYDAAAIKTPPAESSISRLSQDIEKQTGSFRQPGKTNGPMKAVFGGRNKHDGYGTRIHSGNEDNGEYLKGGVNKRSVWTIPTSPYSGAHFAVFPPKLIEPCILAGCPVGGTVLDPFGGSGTTGQVAIKHRRKAILIELNPEYVELQQKRTSNVEVMLF